MDLDVGRALEPHVLREKMNRLLSGAALGTGLRTAGMDIGRVSAPKQTDTTQRWKVELVPRHRPAISLHTKLEFSRRTTGEEAVLEAVSPEILRTYQLLPLLVRHYPAEAALRQKLGALVGRAAVQARDVFDLGVLLGRVPDPRHALEGERAALRAGMERAMDVSFDDYRGQVVAYLHPDHAGMYGSRPAWDALQASVIDALEKASA
jgi:hypothetical protein